MPETTPLSHGSSESAWGWPFLVTHATRIMLKKSITWVLGCTVWVLSATAAAQTTAPPVELAADAPDSYTVVRGDTLWGIAGRFLRSPWRWPEVWQLNREQIANPHLIYPGNVVFLDRSSQPPRLRLGQSVSDSTARLSPRVRVSPPETEAIPTLDLSTIQFFLNRPLIDEHA